MRLNKGKIYIHLFEYQQRFGGYTGKDLDNIARALGFNRRTLKRNVEKWSKNDPLFAELKYIGKRSISVTLEDIAIVNQRLKENITDVTTIKQMILDVKRIDFNIDALILDRGMSSKTNLKALAGSHLKIIGGIPLTSNEAKELVECDISEENELIRPSGLIYYEDKIG